MSNPKSNIQANDRNDDNQIAHLATMPENIVLDKWSESGFEWSGVVAPTSFERLSALLTDDHEQSNLQLSTRLYRQSNVIHLATHLKGEVWLTCQRCLQPVAVDLTDDYDIALLEDDSQVGLIDEETQDYLLLDEVISEQTPERLLPIKKMIEDEIILKTPMAPKHDDCEMAASQVGDIPEEETENPFAALAALKGKL
ncbi:DUF177 domain-containing protein [uncultured Psychrobacter sp.]|uniref:YceD family protein n=1 Tax=uncultured Psychrobacter sp. TaxID=259303 RepID=UPI00345AFBE8